MRAIDPRAGVGAAESTPSMVGDIRKRRLRNRARFPDVSHSSALECAIMPQALVQNLLKNLMGHLSVNAESWQASAFDFPNRLSIPGRAADETRPLNRSAWALLRTLVARAAGTARYVLVCLPP